MWIDPTVNHSLYFKSKDTAHVEALWCRLNHSRPTPRTVLIRNGDSAPYVNAPHMDLEPSSNPTNVPREPHIQPACAKLRSAVEIAPVKGGALIIESLVE